MPEQGYAFVSAHQDEVLIATMCRVLDVSRSGYYAWRSRRPSPRTRANQELLAKIRSVYERSRGTYGAVRVHQELRAQGHQVNRKRVARLMRAEGLVGVTRRRKRPRTTRRDPDAVPAEDLV